VYLKSFLLFILIGCLQVTSANNFWFCFRTKSRITRRPCQIVATSVHVSKKQPVPVSGLRTCSKSVSMRLSWRVLRQSTSRCDHSNATRTIIPRLRKSKIICCGSITGCLNSFNGPWIPAVLTPSQPSRPSNQPSKTPVDAIRLQGLIVGLWQQPHRM